MALKIMEISEIKKKKKKKKSFANVRRSKGQWATFLSAPHKGWNGIVRPWAHVPWACTLSFSQALRPERGLCDCVWLLLSFRCKNKAGSWAAAKWVKSFQLTLLVLLDQIQPVEQSFINWSQTLGSRTSLICQHLYYLIITTGCY